MRVVTSEGHQVGADLDAHVYMDIWTGVFCVLSYGWCLASFTEKCGWGKFHS